MATHCSILAWEIPWTDERAWWATVHGVAKNRTRMSARAHTHTHTHTHTPHTYTDTCLKLNGASALGKGMVPPFIPVPSALCLQP